MTPYRYQSSVRLLRGIRLLEARNQLELSKLTEKREALQKEQNTLVRLIEEMHSADTRLIQPMSRRVSTTAKAIELCKEDLEHAVQKNLKLDRSRNLLLARMKLHEVEKQEEELAEIVTSFVAKRYLSQSATRNLH
jgi:Ni,Fe-hydrogenase I large subunit